MDRKRNWTPRVESKKFIEIKKKVRDRENNRCIICQKSAKYGEIHHIKKWADSPHLRYDEKNLCLLCKKCHNNTKGKEEYYEPMLYIKVKIKYEK
jgi:5-methylcytosine-specific restriction endonuclease McrA